MLDIVTWVHVVYLGIQMSVWSTLGDTLALATGTRVGASVHAIALFVLNMVVSLGFCTPIHYIYINSVV